MAVVDMAMYIGNNPQFVVTGFIHLGIAGALDGYPQVLQEAHDKEDQQDSDSDSDMYIEDEDTDEAEDEEEAESED